MSEYFAYDGTAVRLTDERRDHILQHPEMVEMLESMGACLLEPEHVIQSVSDEAVRLFYRFMQRTKVGDKWLCVVVKWGADSFVITAYLTDRIKAGETLWPVS